MDTRGWLKDMARSAGQRGEPIHFAGRHAELDHILRVARNPQPGNTIIVQGAPGAGKSALLREAGMRFEAADRSSLRYDTPWQKDGESDVLKEIATAAFGVDPATFETDTTSSKSARGSLLSTVGGSMTRSRRRRPVELTNWTAFSRAYRGDADGANALLILADESQAFEGDADGLLGALHGQSRFPFTLVCGGLSDTEDVLSAMGVSRTNDDAVIRLRALTLDEARESIRETLRWTLDRCEDDPPFRHDAELVDRWTDTLAERSFGWPQHIASLLQGTWEALADAAEPDLGDDRILGAALAHGIERCRRYYDGRMAASGADPAVILAAHRAVRLDDGAADVERVFAAIEAAVADLEPGRAAIHRRRHPDGTADCLAAMLKAGAIEETGNRQRIGIPIPSFTAYLEEICGARPTGRERTGVTR